jgi:hypothetical protein
MGYPSSLLHPLKRKEKRSRSRRGEERGEWVHTYIVLNLISVIAHGSPTLLSIGFVLRHNTRIWESNQQFGEQKYMGLGFRVYVMFNVRLVLVILKLVISSHLKC